MARGRTKSSRDAVEGDYRENLGRDPVELYPEGTEGHKQFAYRGTTEADAETLALLGAGFLDEDEAILDVDPDQASLF